MATPDSSPDTTKLPGTPISQLSVFLENRVGALLSIVKMINDLKVEVIGLSVVDSVDAAVVRLILTDPDTVSTRFIERGIPFSETWMLAVELDGVDHGMAECFSILLEGEMNIHFGYPLLSRPNGKAALVLCLEDLDFGRTILHKAGFRLLYQEDLSR